jgi:anti-anti-sigma factor
MFEPAPFAVTFDDAVTVSGDVDMASAPEMQRVLRRALDDGRPGLVVDMAACGFIDCIGLGVLVGAANIVRARGGAVTLRTPSFQVCRLRDLAGLSDVLATGSDEQPTSSL